MSSKNLVKSLLTMEDIAQGVGTVSQQRGDQSYLLGKVDVPYSVNSNEALKRLDVSKFTVARVFTTPASYKEYYYDLTDLTGITPNVGTGSWLERTNNSSSTGGGGGSTGPIDRDDLTPGLIEELDLIAINRNNLESQQSLIAGLDNSLADAVVQLDAQDSNIQQEISDLISSTATDRTNTAQGFVDVADRFTVVEDDLGQTTSNVNLVIAVINDPETGLAVTRSTLLNDYYTATSTDSAISTATSSLRGEVFDGNNISSAFVDSMDSALSNGNGSIATSFTALSASIGTLGTDLNAVEASLSADYYTIAQTDSAISAQITTISSVLNDPITGLAATRADLSSNYYTSAQADTAIAASTNALSSQIFTVNGDLAAAFVTSIESAISNDPGSALASRVEALETEISDPATGLSITRSELITTQSSLATESSTRASQITTLESTLRTDLGDDIAAVSAIANSTQVTAAGNILAVSNLNNRVDSFEGNITAATNLSQAAQSTADGNTSAITELDTRVSSNETGLAATNTLAQAAQTTADGNASALTALTSRVTTAEGNISASGLVLNNTVTTVTNIEGDITGITSDVANINGDITEINSDIANINGDITGINSDITSITGDVTGINQAITTINGTITGIDNSILGINSDLVAINQNITNNDSDISAINISLASLNTLAGTADTNASSALNLVSIANTDINNLESRASLVASTTANGRTIVSGMQATATATETKLDFAGDVVRFLDQAGDPKLYIDTVNDELRFEGTLRSAKTEIIAGSVMIVISPVAFGPDNLIEWRGPVILDGSGNPDYANLTKNNGTISWLDIAGNPYFGGAISAGILKNGVESSTVGLNPEVEIGSFGSNGGARIIVCSFSLSGSYQEPSGSSNPAPSNPVQPSGTLRLERQNGASWDLLSSINITGTTTVEDFITEPGAPEWLTTENLSGSFTFTDNSVVANVNYRVRLINQVRYHQDQFIISQRLSIVSTES